MHKFLLPLIVLGFSAGCGAPGFNMNSCGPFSDCCGIRPSYNPCDCKPCNCTKPALNAMGMPYDGSGSPCYRSPGPFWCWLPGPCSTCRDPWVVYYDSSCKADVIGRHVSHNCDDTMLLSDDPAYMSAKKARPVAVAYDRQEAYDESADE